MVLAGDQSHDNFLANLATVQGNVTLDPGHTNPGNVLMGLTHVGGTVTLEDDCHAMPGPLGPPLFNSLTTIGGDLKIFHVTRTVLHNLLLSLTAVGGTMRVEGSAVTDFPLGAPTMGTHPMLTLGALSVTDNPALMSFNASYVRVLPTGAITIQNNCVLPAATAMSFVSDQMAAGWSGTANVSGNGTGAFCNPCFRSRVRADSRACYGRALHALTIGSLRRSSGAAAGATGAGSARRRSGIRRSQGRPRAVRSWRSARRAARRTSESWTCASQEPSFEADHQRGVIRVDRHGLRQSGFERPVVAQLRVEEARSEEPCVKVRRYERVIDLLRPTAMKNAEASVGGGRRGAVEELPRALGA
jgi:hypothetical protein